jgi:hypothetical protein
MRNFLCEGTSGVNCTASTVVADDGTIATVASQGGGSNSVQFSDTVAHTFATSARFFSTAAVAGQVLRLPFSASTVTGAVRLYHQAATLPPVNWTIMTLRGTTTNRIILNTNGSMSIASNAGTVLATTDAGAWDVDRWNRVEVWFDGSGAAATHDLFLAVYNADGVSATGTASRTNTTVSTSMDAIDIGQPVSNGAWEHWFDTVGLEVNVTDFLGPYVIPSVSRDGTLSGSGALSVEVDEVAHNRTAALSGAGTLVATVSSELHTRSVALTGSGSLAGAAASNPARAVGLSGAGTLSAAAEILPFVVSLSGTGTLGTMLVKGTVTPPITFSYWEKRRKDFGSHGEFIADELKPFWYQSYPQGVTLVRYADGSYAPVAVVTEELEALDGARVLWGGKDNVVSLEEAERLTAAGYGDYLTFPPEAEV